MPVNSIDFLTFAKSSMQRKDEIGFRNAVARAYYCAYHHVLPCMQLGPKDSHQGLIDYLKNDSWKGNENFAKADLVGLGYILDTMKAKRVISDYRLDANVTETEAKVAILSAENLISKCADMNKSQAS